MSKYKSLLRRERIAATAAQVGQLLETLLAASGIKTGFKVCQSKRTGSVYIKVRLLDLDGRKIKDAGVAIRVSDHRRPGARWANFSQPARRFYGIWFAASPSRIVEKIGRIVRHILQRADRRRKGGDA